MNRRILFSMVLIVATLAIVGGATLAYFTDIGTSTRNVFSVGSVDLKLGNNTTATSDTVSATIGGSGLQPGHTAVTGTLNIRNSGTVTANHIDISFVDVITTPASGPGNGGTSILDRYLKITQLTYDNVDYLSQVVNSNGNSIIDLEDLKNNNKTGGDLQNLSLTNTDVDHPLVMGIQLDSSAPNDLQGHSLSMDMTITLDQGPSHL